MKQSLIVIILLAFFALNSCDDILDCIINVRPILSKNHLKTGALNEYYWDKIFAEVKNEPYDNGYYYDFRVYGALPKGIEIIYEYREVIFEGTPEESGIFTINVDLNVEPKDSFAYDVYGNEVYNNPLCADNTSKNYTITIK